MIKTLQSHPVTISYLQYQQEIRGILALFSKLLVTESVLFYVSHICQGYLNIILDTSSNKFRPDFQATIQRNTACTHVRCLSYETFG